jgi:hypothetical protein
MKQASAPTNHTTELKGIWDSGSIGLLYRLGHTSKMFGLLLALALLGLASIDPIGIAAMPVLLVQDRPFGRSFTFLGGSFTALMVVGVLFARGLGISVLHFENSHNWLVPDVEITAGLVLIGLAITLLKRAKTGQLSVEPSGRVARSLRMGNWQLFGLGAIIVSIQSMVDVVFVIAMIRVGQLNLSNAGLAAAIASYAAAALALQLAVVAAYRLASPRQRTKTLAKVRQLIKVYANQALITVSFALGGGLLITGLVR